MEKQWTCAGRWWHACDRDARSPQQKYERIQNEIRFVFFSFNTDAWTRKVDPLPFIN